MQKHYLILELKFVLCSFLFCYCSLDATNQLQAVKKGKFSLCFRVANLVTMADESLQEELDFEQELDYEHEAAEQMVGLTLSQRVFCVYWV